MLNGNLLRKFRALFSVVAFFLLSHTALGDISITGLPMIVTGAGPGGGPHVKGFSDLYGSTVTSFMAYNIDFRGGVSVAIGDINGDGIPDIITGAGPGGGPHVIAFDGATGRVLLSFMAYDINFTGGVSVAVGDVNADGFGDIITGAGPSGGPHVKVFDGLTGVEKVGFFAYAPSFRGGVRVAVGDVTGDGVLKIITGPGPGMDPVVKVFDGFSGAELSSFLAFPLSLRGGISVAAADFDRVGMDNIIVGAGAGGNSEVRILRGDNGRLLSRFQALSSSFRGAINVAVTDIDGDGIPDIIVGAGAGGSALVRVFSGNRLSLLGEFLAYDASFRGGVAVAGVR